jgi:hypothetical protein
MRKFQIAAVVAFGMVLFAGAQLARAQSLDAVTTTVPFPFMVGKVLLPAGTYLIVPDDMEPGVLEIRSERGGRSAFATLMAEDTTTRRGDLQFQFVNVGGRYYLTKIDDGTGDVSEVAVPDAVLRVMHASARTQVQK